MNIRTILLLGLFAAFVGVASCYKIYALSNTFDVWENGSWHALGPRPGETYYEGTQSRLQLDKENNIVLEVGSDLHNGGSGVPPWPRVWNTTTNYWGYAPSPYYGPFTIASDDAICATDRYGRLESYAPALWCSKSAVYEVRYGIFQNPPTDLTMFRQGNAIVVAGEFTQVLADLVDGSAQPNGTLLNVSSNVALFDTKTQTWQSMGVGIPSVPRRIVSNSDGTQLVALSDQNTIWRWNGTSKLWARHDIALTSIHGEPSISDLAYGGEKLFVVGNFDKVNGVVAKNVTMLSFGPKESLSVAGIGLGLPGVQPKTVFARSATQIFIGGSAKGDRKVVYEWRQGRNIPWGRIGATGLLDPSEGSGPVYGVIVTN